MSKKGKLIFGIAVAVAWIVVLTLAAVFLLPKLLEQAPQQEKGRDAEETVQLALDGVIAGGTEEAVLLGADGTPVGVSASTGLAALISEKIEYEIVSVQTDDEIGTAQLQITAPDTVALVKQALDGMESYDEALLIQRMENLLKEDHPTAEYTVEVELVKVEADWCLVTNSQFGDAITGGLISRYWEVQLAIMDALAGGEGE